MLVQYILAHLLNRLKSRSCVQVSTRIQIDIRRSSDCNSEEGYCVAVFNLRATHCELRTGKLGLCSCEFQSSLLSDPNLYLDSTHQVLNQLKVFLRVLNLFATPQRIVESVLDVSDHGDCGASLSRLAAGYSKLRSLLARTSL
jgi:hypothetical protein